MAIQAAHQYLHDHDGAKGVRAVPDGSTIVSSADTAGINVPWLPYETSGGGSFFFRTFSTVCVDPEAVDLAAWEARVGSRETSPDPY